MRVATCMRCRLKKQIRGDPYLPPSINHLRLAALHLLFYICSLLSVYLCWASSGRDQIGVFKFLGRLLCIIDVAGQPIGDWVAMFLEVILP